MYDEERYSVETWCHRSDTHDLMHNDDIFSFCVCPDGDDGLWMAKKIARWIAEDKDIKPELLKQGYTCVDIIVVKETKNNDGFWDVDAIEPLFRV